MDTIKALPEPQKDLPFPLMKALQNRRTTRKWTLDPVSEQDISNLLWAACGMSVKATRTAKQKRTAPSAANCQEIRLFVALPEGLYEYDEANHTLVLRMNKDIRDSIGTQKMMKSAPVGIVFVSDYSRMKTYLSKDDARKWFVSGTDAGFISQNIYLYCAAANLSTAVLGLVDREELGSILGLYPHENVVYTQVVGNAR
ncbi:MAG TPA: nitroreductase [Spirochaetaceae bacterium]|nr:nitroreductase [Spirochaetaceae bacterium]